MGGLGLEEVCWRVRVGGGLWEGWGWKEAIPIKRAGRICLYSNVLHDLFQEMSSEGGFRTVSVLDVPVSYNLARIEVACIANSLHREKKTFKTIRIQSRIYSDPVWRIRDVFYPGSRIRIFSFPDPHQKI